MQKDLAFDVNPMLSGLLLQALQHAIHFLAGKEMEVLQKVPVKSILLRRSLWHVNTEKPEWSEIWQHEAYTEQRNIIHNYQIHRHFFQQFQNPLQGVFDS